MILALNETRLLKKKDEIIQSSMKQIELLEDSNFTLQERLRELESFRIKVLDSLGLIAVNEAEKKALDKIKFLNENNLKG